MAKPRACLLAQQFSVKEIYHAAEKVVACVSPGDAVISVRVDLHFKLFVGLHKGFGIFHGVAEVDVVVGHSVDKEQSSLQLRCAGYG